MTGQEVKQALTDAGVSPSKQMGQNFLIDPNMARWIVRQLDLKPEDAVVEVGPGTGALSEHLVGAVRQLVLIEFDARLAEALTTRYAGRQDVVVHHADAARFDIRLLFKLRPVKFLGNLPYSSGGAILKNLLSHPHPFSRAVVMLQKEVIDRLAAAPRDDAYGILTLRTQVAWHVDVLRTVPPEAFYPRPSIDSAVAVLHPRTDGLPSFDRKLFDELVRRGFAQRRKQLAKQMPQTRAWSEIAELLEIPTTSRAEELSLEQWVELTRAYDDHPLKDLPQSEDELFDVVDAEDQPVSLATRREVHRAKHFHRAVHVFVFNPRGELLIQQRSMLKDEHPGVWGSSVSGHLNAGETYHEAAQRELEEEMGIISDEAPTEILQLAADQQTGMEHLRVFRITHHGKIRFPASEVQSAIWMPIPELIAWMNKQPDDFSRGFTHCFKAAYPMGKM